MDVLNKAIFLQDYGGSPTLFGVASVINHISEIFAYFFSFRLITQIGHVKVQISYVCSSACSEYRSDVDSSKQIHIQLQISPYAK